MKEEWLFRGALVPIDAATTAALVAEIKRLIDVVGGMALAQPAQEPVAINQHRIPYCADWYDGIPDYHDGHGPYEVRTLYTTPPKRPWVGLTEEDIENCMEMSIQKTCRAIEAKLKEKNT